MPTDVMEKVWNRKPGGGGGDHNNSSGSKKKKVYKSRELGLDATGDIRIECLIARLLLYFAL